nr:hypothetical protein [Streptomonospora nanhaiensis]
MNKAALLASDTGRPELAAALCRRQHEMFLQAAPLSVKAATFALQPLVNLGRLSLRAGNPIDAYTFFASLFTAAHPGGHARLQGRTFPVGDLVATPGERTELRRFLWAVLIADGTRALCAAGHWEEAVDHLHRHNGIGTRLLDGRQVAVLAALHRNDPEEANRLLRESVCDDAWERAVAACLTTAARRAAAHDTPTAVTAMASAVAEVPSTPGGAVFTARLGTLACELAPHHTALASTLIDLAMESDDAHAATAVLGSPAVEPRLSDPQRCALRMRVNAAQLVGSGSGHYEDDAELTKIGEQAAALAAHHLSASPRRDR